MSLEGLHRLAPGYQSPPAIMPPRKSVRRAWWRPRYRVVYNAVSWAGLFRRLLNLIAYVPPTCLHCGWPYDPPRLDPVRGGYQPTPPVDTCPECAKLLPAPPKGGTAQSKTPDEALAMLAASDDIFSPRMRAWQKESKWKKSPYWCQKHDMDLARCPCVLLELWCEREHIGYFTSEKEAMRAWKRYRLANKLGRKAFTLDSVYGKDKQLIPTCEHTAWGTGYFDAGGEYNMCLDCQFREYVCGACKCVLQAWLRSSLTWGDKAQFCAACARLPEHCTHMTVLSTMGDPDYTCTNCGTRLPFNPVSSDGILHLPGDVAYTKLRYDAT